MLSPATRTAADHLITALMALVRAVAPVALDGSTPTLSDHAAGSLFLRLSHLVKHLIRLVTEPSLPKPRAATPGAARATATARRAAPPSAPGLPRRPGWLLDALPDLAPVVAADLAVLLADPACADLLAVSPSLARALRPVLRGLGLHAPLPALPPSAGPAPPSGAPVPPSGAPAPSQAPGPPPSPPARSKTAEPSQGLFTPTSFRFSNRMDARPG